MKSCRQQGTAESAEAPELGAAADTELDMAARSNAGPVVNSPFFTLQFPLVFNGMTPAYFGNKNVVVNLKPQSGPPSGASA